MEFSSWVDCLVSIRFDLDIGPKIESISPAHAITDEGKVKLLHCAFPDCNPDCGYNFIFYFTMPDCTTAAAQSFSQTVAPPTTGNTVPELYGAAFYRQKHDPKVPRRYVQQVVVLLSHLPYYNVHELILRVVAPRFCQCCPLSPDTGKVPVSSVLSPVPEAYFEVDQSYTPAHYTQEDVLRDAMQELAQWPSPHPQVRYSVNLLQQALVFMTPAHSLRQSIRATRSSCAAVRTPMSVDQRVEFMEVARGNARYRGSSFGNDVLPLFSLLGEQLHHLTYVWELLLRHEPLFILSNTPSVASATAFSVASLILPIQFNGTLRSYFTVQNDDFPRLSRMGKALPFPTNEALIVAGTNPFLLRSFSGWPSMLVVMDRNTAHVVNGSVASSPTAASMTRDGRGNGNSSGGGGVVVGRDLGSLVPLSPSSFSSKPVTPAPRATLDEARCETPSLPGHDVASHAFPSLFAHHDVSFPASPSTGFSEATLTSGSFDSTGGSNSGMVSASASHTMRASLSAATRAGAAPLHPLSEANHTHVTMVPASSAVGNSGSTISLSALVRTPTAKQGDGTILSEPAPYEADPHAAYALESSTDSSTTKEAEEGHQQQQQQSLSPSSRSSTPPSHQWDANKQGSGEHVVSTAVAAAAHARVTSPLVSPGMSGSQRRDAATRRSSLSSPPVTPVPLTMPAPVGSSVTLFTMDNYKTTVESVHAADYRKRGGGHQEVSRTNLQQRLHNYFDSSVHFLLNHAEQSRILLKRLEMVSLLDAEAQRTSVTLSLNQWQGSPTTVSSPWRRNSGGHSSAFPTDPSSAGLNVTPASGPTSSPSSVSKTSSFPKHVDPTSMEHGITSCSHFSVADDILRKFFTSLTTEFLTPVTAWYQKVTSPYTAFHLCDRALCDSLLSPASFLSDFALRHRETAPSMWTQLHSYKTYKVVYERFANGCLFKAYVCQLLEDDLRRQLDAFQIEEWVVRVPSEAERIDLLISLLSTIQRELNETLDPDVLLVTSATSVMASMAVGLHEPHREQFMLKIGELKL
jgi:hypothetical protein